MVLKKVIFSLAMIGSIGISATCAQQTIFNVTDPSFNGGVAWIPDWNPSRSDNGKIHAAINAAISTNSGGVIYFPKGFYFVDATFEIGDGNTTSWWAAGQSISIKGDGMSVTVIYPKSSNSLFFFRGGQGASNPDAGSPILSRRNTISDLSILKTQEAGCSSGGTALDLTGASGVIVDNVEIMTCGQCRFAYGIQLLFDEFRMHHMYIGFCMHGIALRGHCNSTSITESQFWYNDYGISVFGGASIRIQNNTFGGNFLSGIQVETNREFPTNTIWSLLISGNEMEGNGSGQFDNNHIWIKNNITNNQLTDLVKGVTISDNYFNLRGSSHNIPYDIPRSEQRFEITFNKNVYWTGPMDNPVVRTEQFTTNSEQYPITIPPQE